MNRVHLQMKHNLLFFLSISFKWTLSRAFVIAQNRKFVDRLASW